MKRPLRCHVVRVRVEPDRSYSLAEQVVHMLADKGRSMARPDQVGLANIEIHSARGLREVTEGVTLPSVDVIVLDEGEGSALQLADPHRNPGVSELFRLRLLCRPAPPTRDVWPPSPAQKQWQVRLADGTDDVSRLHGLKITPKAGLRNGRSGWLADLDQHSLGRTSTTRKRSHQSSISGEKNPSR